MIGSIREKVPNSNGNMTHIKRRSGHGSDDSPMSNDRIHISRPGRGLHVGKNINKKMTRDPRRGLSIIILHTIMRSERIHPHEMSGHHGGG